LKNNESIVILSLIKNTLKESVNAQNISELINSRNKNLVEVNKNFNIGIIDRLGKKFFYNKSKVNYEANRE
jgi:hypothetical protein